MREIKRFGRMYANPEKPPSGGAVGSDPLKGNTNEWVPHTNNLGDVISAAQRDMEARHNATRDQADKIKKMIEGLDDDQSEAGDATVHEVVKTSVSKDEPQPESVAPTVSPSQITEARLDEVFGPNSDPEHTGTASSQAETLTAETGTEATQVSEPKEGVKWQQHFKEGEDTVTAASRGEETGLVSIKHPKKYKGYDKVRNAYQDPRATGRDGKDKWQGANYTIDEFPENTPEGVQQSIERVRSSLDNAADSSECMNFTIREEDLTPGGRRKPIKSETAPEVKKIKDKGESEPENAPENTPKSEKETKKSEGGEKQSQPKAAQKTETTPEKAKEPSKTKDESQAGNAEKKEEPKKSDAKKSEPASAQTNPKAPEKTAQKSQTLKSPQVEFAPGANFATGNSSSFVEGGQGETITDYATFDNQTRYLYQKDTGPYNEPKMFENVTGNEQTLTASVAETVPMNWGSKEKSPEVNNEGKEGKGDKEKKEGENENPEGEADKTEGEKPKRISFIEIIRQALSSKNSKEATPAEAPKRGWFGRFFRGIGLIIKGTAIVVWETLKLGVNLVITAGEAIWEGGKSFFGKGGGAKS